MESNDEREQYECFLKKIFAILVDAPDADDGVRQDIRDCVASGLVSRCLRHPDDYIGSCHESDEEVGDSGFDDKEVISDYASESDLRLVDCLWRGESIDYSSVHNTTVNRVLDLMFSRKVTSFNDFLFAIGQIENTIAGQDITSSTNSILWFLADVYSVLGRYEKALEILQSLIERDNSDMAQHKLLMRIINIKQKYNIAFAGTDIVRFGRPSEFNLTRVEFKRLLQKCKRYINTLVAEVLLCDYDFPRILGNAVHGVINLFWSMPTLRTFLEAQKTQLVDSNMTVPDVNGHDESLFPIVTSLYRDMKLIGIQSRDVSSVEKDWECCIKLYKKLKSTFPTEQIIHHYSTPWLWKFTLAVYFPNLNLAFDYRGEEVMNPRNYPGGISGQKEYFRLYDRTVAKATKEYGIFVIRIGADVPYDEIVDYVYKAMAARPSCVITGCV